MLVVGVLAVDVVVVVVEDGVVKEEVVEDVVGKVELVVDLVVVGLGVVIKVAVIV